MIGSIIIGVSMVALKGDRFESLDKNFTKNIERVIKMLSKFENSYYAPVFRMTSEAYKNISYIRDHISVEVASHEREDEVRQPLEISAVSSNELQEEKELLEVRLNQAKDILASIINRATSSVSTGGKVCKLSNEEYQDIKSFVDRCTIQ